jgi:hypothetical protein
MAKAHIISASNTITKGYRSIRGTVNTGDFISNFSLVLPAMVVSEIDIEIKSNVLTEGTPQTACLVALPLPGVNQVAFYEGTLDIAGKAASIMLTSPLTHEITAIGFEMTGGSVFEDVSKPLEQLVSNIPAEEMKCPLVMMGAIATAPAICLYDEQGADVKKNTVHMKPAAFSSLVQTLRHTRNKGQ